MARTPMFYLIGTDEAGYGPNLGPLVITATVWRLDRSEPLSDLYPLLSSLIRRGSRTTSRRWLRIDDSKVLYQAGGSLELLEEGVLVALGALGRQIPGWRDAWRVLAPTSCDQMSGTCWYEDFQCALPAWADLRRITRLTERFLRATCQAGLELVDIRSRVLFPDGFNAALEQCGSKGEVLSRATMELVWWACDLAAGKPCHITCDKHGGRNFYRTLLEEHLLDEFIWTLAEGRDESRYRWGENEIRFCTDGERSLPTALASMVSKYLRELAMRAFNDYWRQRVPDLRPTAGYPADAHRFFQQIEPMLAELAIGRQRVWRNR